MTNPSTPVGQRLDLTQTTITLPKPASKGSLSVEEALAKRRSLREFSSEPLSLKEIGQLLWAAQGITDAAGRRAAPSAGARYPLEMYVITPEGMFHYDPREHQLTRHLTGDVRPAVAAASLGQEMIQDSPAVFAFAAVYERTEQKYGKERGGRYVLLDLGHAAQNLILQATALGLGTVPVGAFRDEPVKKALALPEDQQPLYLIPVGHPRR